MTTPDVIPAYPYVQFADDVNISAWFTAYNTYAQQYLDWFNDTPLFDYTNPNVTGDFLDWMANGVYGVYRTPIANTRSRSIGPVNTYTPNELPFNQGETFSNSTSIVMNDDVFRRLITWDFYKGDGLQFTIAWLKRRIARFIYGINGFSDTNEISVTVNSDRTFTATATINQEYQLYAQQLAALLVAQIPQLPYGYTGSLIWVDGTVREDDFGGDIA